LGRRKLSNLRLEWLLETGSTINAPPTPEETAIYNPIAAAREVLLLLRLTAGWILLLAQTVSYSIKYKIEVRLSRFQASEVWLVQLRHAVSLASGQHMECYQMLAGFQFPRKKILLESPPLHHSDTLRLLDTPGYFTRDIEDMATIFNAGSSVSEVKVSNLY